LSRRRQEADASTRVSGRELYTKAARHSPAANYSNGIISICNSV